MTKDIDTLDRMILESLKQNQNLVTGARLGMTAGGIVEHIYTTYNFDTSINTVNRRLTRLALQNKYTECRPVDWSPNKDKTVWDITEQGKQTLQ